MSDFIEFRNRCLDYLHLEQALIDRDIAEHEAMSAEEREEHGLLIRNAQLKCRQVNSVVYTTAVNNTKLRAGDEVVLTSVDGGKSYGKFVVDVNSVEEIAFAVGNEQIVPECVNVEVREFQGLDLVLKMLGVMRPGSPGVSFMEYLANCRAPSLSGLGGIAKVGAEEIPDDFNEAQREAVRMIAGRPKLAYVQGTPGSGKTQLLAVASKLFASRGRDVAIVALTHQAVNNALNKVAKLIPGGNVVKIGRVFKNEGLSDNVARHENFFEYVKSRKARGDFFTDYGHVVGMSFLSAITNLGTRRSAFMPQILLFDEAGQMPLTHSAVLGAFKCGSVVLVGDDRQMPPIYHQDLLENDLSISVFEVVKKLYPRNGIVLNVTYRMNEEITNLVGNRYYEPYGIDLVSAKNSIGNRLNAMNLTWRSRGERSVNHVLCECPGACDENPVEAERVVEVVGDYLDKGLASNRMAVITPYRRQVRLIHAKLREQYGRDVDLPLVDTVERLQGQDVELIIASFVVDNLRYYESQRRFLLNPNRLNVMFSRATSKVIVLASRLMLAGLGVMPPKFDHGPQQNQ